MYDLLWPKRCKGEADGRQLEKVSLTFQKGKLGDSIFFLALGSFMSRCDAWNHGNLFVIMRKACLGT